MVDDATLTNIDIPPQVFSKSTGTFAAVGLFSLRFPQ
jgi:hypothetical protein